MKTSMIEPYENLMRAALRMLDAERLDGSHAHDDDEKMYAEDGLLAAAQRYALADVPSTGLPKELVELHYRSELAKVLPGARDPLPSLPSLLIAAGEMTDELARLRNAPHGRQVVREQELERVMELDILIGPQLTNSLLGQLITRLRESLVPVRDGNAYEFNAGIIRLNNPE